MKASYEHIYNGNMELDAGWTAVSGSAVRSTDFVHSRTYSLKATLGQYNEIHSNPWTSFAGIEYRFSFWMYRTSGIGEVWFAVRKGGDPADNSLDPITPTNDMWVKHEGTFTETAGGSGAFLKLIASTVGQVIYFDDLSIYTKVQAAPDPYYNRLINEKQILITPDTRK